MTSQRDAQTEREIISQIGRQVAEGSSTLGLHIKQHDDISEQARKWAEEVIENAVMRLEGANREASDQTLQSLQSITEALRQNAEQFSETVRQQAAGNEAALRETASAMAQASQELLQQWQASVNEAGESIAKRTERLLTEQKTVLEQITGQFQAILQQQNEENRKLWVEQEEKLRQERQRQLKEHQEIRDQTIELLKTEMAATLEQAAKTNQETLEQTAAKANEEYRVTTGEAVYAMDRRWSRFTKTIIGLAIISSAVAVALTATLVTLL